MAEEELKQAEIIYARAHHVHCPHCEANVEGWFGDPTGIATTCDECKQPFKVASNAEVRLT